MAGRIRQEDILTVRERARIDEVVSAYVTLRNAGGGNLKGLCPFHDEKTPSFSVTPARGMFYCFGCQAGGDVIKFLMDMDGLTFTETVERLAAEFGVELRYESGESPQRRDGPQRPRLVEAHRVAQEFYAENLARPDAGAGREFLLQRDLGQSLAEKFGVGFAPRDGAALYRHLRQLRFTDEEVVAAGLVARSPRGHYDRFRGRLVWPIRNTSGDTVGFGARRIFDDDRVQAKYLNTPETLIYQKSRVLYGIDMARRHIARQSQAVIVEGYTDVMACHAAGVTTAVATCGTAFGDDHARVIRRLMSTDDEFQGEVIFTFDGDEAGQAAAMKAFDQDQIFTSQTYVAIDENGMDPCELRQHHGDEAVRSLILNRVPLYRFAARTIVARYDLDRADGRVEAMRAATKLVVSERDQAKQAAFARELAGLVGLEPGEVLAQVRRDANQRGRKAAPMSHGSAVEARQQSVLPDPRDQRLVIEREALKLLIQHPAATVPLLDSVTIDDFTHPAYRWVWAQWQEQGSDAAAATGWVWQLLDTDIPPHAHQLLSALAVEPALMRGEVSTAYITQTVFRLRELGLGRHIDQVKSQLRRQSQGEDATDDSSQHLFATLMELETRRRLLRETAMEAQ